MQPNDKQRRNETEKEGVRVRHIFWWDRLGGGQSLISSKMRNRCQSKEKMQERATFPSTLNCLDSNPASCSNRRFCFPFASHIRIPLPSLACGLVPRIGNWMNASIHRRNSSYRHINHLHKQRLLTHYTNLSVCWNDLENRPNEPVGSVEQTS